MNQQDFMSPDQIVLWQRGPFALNATILFTWGVIALVTTASWLVTRKLTVGSTIPRWQNVLEVVVESMSQQIRDVAQRAPEPYLPFIGTIFIFIAVSNALMVVPGYIAPTGSLSTTVALALLVFVAVPVYGVAETGVWRYLRRYVHPTPFMLPFNVIGELSRTLALAVRLFGNVMSGAKTVGILVAIAPLFFPVLMQILGLLTGLVQAYIFAILAMVYIGSANRPDDRTGGSADPSTEEVAHE